MIQIDKTMPQSCYYCPCTNDGFYMCLLADKQLEDNCEDSRPTWCPLHEYTDTDTISRKQAIDALFEILDRPKHADFLYADEIHRALSNLPPSPSRPPWIPVTGRLPEDKQEVLVTEYGDTDIGRRFEGRWLDRYGDKMKDVTAWMPKPVPYAERRTE